MHNIIEVDKVSVSFGTGAKRFYALRSVSFNFLKNETLGLVGESGSGKSTLAKVLSGIYGLTEGRVRIGDQDVTPEKPRSPSNTTSLQMIPQDPYSSLSPRRTVGQTLAEALNPRRPSVQAHEEVIVQWLDRVGLSADSMHKYPYQFSGGQRQRIAIARALCVDPEVLIADEITSALDLSVQAEILDLLQRLRLEIGLSMIFVSHNLGVVRGISDRVAVLFHGELLEIDETDTIFNRPSTNYTRKLLNSIPGAPGFSLKAARVTDEPK